MNKIKSHPQDIENLRELIKQLEKSDGQHLQIEEELRALNQQLEASNQQLQANEQQLRATNEQLKASEQELAWQKQAAEQNREFAESIINTVRQPLLVLDQNLKIVTANQYFYRFFKASEKETIGNLLYDLGNKQWDIPKLKELLKKTLPERSTVEDFEVEHSFDEIGYKIMLLNARELRQKQHKERLILLAIEDVTSRRKSEAELNRLNKELKLKAEELQQLLYITTHDLRSPLVNIQGFTREMEGSLNDLKKLLENAKLTAAERRALTTVMDDEIPEAIHYITSSATKMDDLLIGLLALSRLGRNKLAFRMLDMNLLIKQVMENFEYEILQNKITAKIDDLLPCIGDEMQLNQLFSNLIGNALKFLDPERKGKVTITSWKDTKGVYYSVEDNGIGIPKEYRKKVFGMFEKLDPKKPGIGLGMNVVKQVAEKHNGEIDLESELGKWTRFTVFIPQRTINKSF